MHTNEIQSYSSCLHDILSIDTISNRRILTDDFEVLTAVAEELDDQGGAESGIKLLCSSDILKQLDRDFLVASTASDLVADSVLNLRAQTGANLHLPTLIFHQSSVLCVLPIGGGDVTTTLVDGEEAKSRLAEHYQSEWKTALPHSIDAPPYSRLLALADQQFDHKTSADMDSGFAVGRTRAPEDRPDPILVSLLICAKNEQLLTDVVEWADTLGLATQGTVSKLKSNLEESGLIDIVEESAGVGRPRQRLRLADESFYSLSAEELIANMQAAL